MELKKIIFISIIAIAILVIGAFGVTYAYYALTNSSTDFEVSTSSDDNNIDIVYRQSEYINVTTGIPITENDVATKASKNSFSVSTSDDIRDVIIGTEIKLTNISLDTALQISDFKIQLVENGSVINTVTGQDIGTSNEIVLKGMSNITIGNTYNYQIRVWINETGVSQNELMGKEFSARITINSAIKK